MFGITYESLLALWEAVRPADVVDVLVISVGIYFTLRWLRSRATRAVAVGLAGFALLYLAARRTDMVLTSWLFQMGFTAVVIGLILVFQNDIRRVFERLGGLVGLIDRTLPLTRGTAEVLAQSLAAMAERRIGALVVLVMGCAQAARARIAAAPRVRAHRSNTPVSLACPQYMHLLWPRGTVLPHCSHWTGFVLATLPSSLPSLRSIFLTSSNKSESCRL